jgi:hypothetical protein
MVIVAVADPPPDPVAVIVTRVADWAAVGVPETTPVVVLRTSPAGSAGDALNVRVPAMPEAVYTRVDVIALPTVADTVCVDGDSEAAATVMVIVAVADPASAPVAVRVTRVDDWAAVGVPDTTPLAVSSVRPAGSVPDVTA